MAQNLEHLKLVTGIEQFRINPEISRGVHQSVMDTLFAEERVEKNKDKLDLKPNIDFVTANFDLFDAALKALLDRKGTDMTKEWAKNIQIQGEDSIVGPQVLPEEAKNLLANMPEVLIHLSKLQTIKYFAFVPVAITHPDGTYDNHCEVEWVPVSEFPRAHNHPSRILIGNSDGENIYSTPIPKTVSEDENAAHIYQAHVLMHEFFHSIDYPRRKAGERVKVLLEVDGQTFTFEDWWQAFEELILSGKEPVCVSSYANTYSDKLNQETKDDDELRADNDKKFIPALAEQMCETFVAYQLGIISNDDGWTDFKSESFGNAEQLAAYMKGKAPSANLKWVLMDKLCRAKLASQPASQTTD